MVQRKKKTILALEDSPKHASRVRSKEKKSGPLVGLSDEERLERYSVLFSFANEEDIDTQALADQWGVSRMGVVGMLHGAKNGRKLYMTT